jgi:hypothetical protein
MCRLVNTGANSDSAFEGTTHHNEKKKGARDTGSLPDSESDTDAAVVPMMLLC